MNKKNIITFIIVLIILLIVIGYISYMYFTDNIIPVILYKYIGNYLS